MIFKKEWLLDAVTNSPYNFNRLTSHNSNVHIKMLMSLCNVWFGGTLSCRDLFQQSADPEQCLTSSNQPTPWFDLNLERIWHFDLAGAHCHVQHIQSGLFGIFVSKNVCLSLNTVILLNIA